MKKLLVIAAATAVVSGCAQQPENIAAVEVGGDAYATLNCRQLAAEELTVSQRLENLSADQRRAANGDAMGVFLLGLPVSSMSGNDREAEIAVARGQLQAIDRQQARRNCS
ncbi:hypothetical protein [Nioella sp.]|jgi:hypothetical protein|uniref:hypothetical protein n=1 Tax=Nioella sp. TaxID=1912091 RepID=UPI003B52ED53